MLQRVGKKTTQKKFAFEAFCQQFMLAETWTNKYYLILLFLLQPY